jgi:polar amino acid transport system substrate-binding protein
MVRFGFDVIPLYSRELALAALFDGRCVGLLYLDSPAIGPLQQTKWGQDFLVPLDILRIPPWSVYLNIHDKDSRLEKWISKTVIDWHREGLILDLEKKWGLPNAIFSIQMNQLWNKKINNKFFCTTPISDQTPRECVE